MKYTPNEIRNASEEFADLLFLPHNLPGFLNNVTSLERTISGREVYCFQGDLWYSEEEIVCEDCCVPMHSHDTYQVTLRHIPIGGSLSCLCFKKRRFQCPCCGKLKMQEIPFKAPGHQISTALLTYAEELLEHGYTNKEVGELTGLGKNVVKQIDLARLKRKYTEGRAGEKLLKPERQARFLGIDEFKLHDGYRFATHIIDLENGHILWIAHGKKKQVVYDFIKHVGLEWMEGVEAVACDMNSDFEEAFEELCPHIQPVFDHFHIMKNFNDKVESAIRKDEQKRLIASGDEEAAKSLKRSRYILTSRRESLRQKDEKAIRGEAGRARNGTLFQKPEHKLTPGYEARYDEILKLNKIFFTADIVKEKLSAAYKLTDEIKMAEEITEIIEMCEASGNEHLQWFGRLLLNHFEGIVAHAAYQISSGKIEGINNKIKTLRRKGYGYPDDDYFFLKLFDASRQGYVRNPKSHKKSD